MNVQCPGCGKNIVACRRYPLEPLAEFMRTTIPAACRAAGISGSSENDARCHGITRRLVDRIAAQLREHPAAIWPEVVDHDIEDTSRTCLECGETFMPCAFNPGQKFCSISCGRRHRDRRWQRRRYHSDPEFRARRATYLAEYKQASQQAIRANRRNYSQARKDAA